MEGYIPSKEEFSNVMDARFTPEVYERLKAGRVGIAGLGGLGSHVAVMLARSGVEHLHLVDFDKVDLSNLNRQEYRIGHLGRYKTEALREQLLEINPYLDIRTDCVRVSDENVASLFKEDTILCEAFDVPENKAMLVNGIMENYRDLIIISASGMAGYGNSNTILSKKITSRFYLCGDGVSDTRKGPGLMAPRVALCAAHQANLAADLIINGTAGDRL